MDAIELLTRDHRHVEELFGQFRSGSDEERRASAEGIIRELSIHAAIEEEIFYPKVAQEVDDAEDLVEEAKVEHASLKTLIGKIEGGSPDSEEFDAQVKVLGEYVKHHVKEEQNEL